MKSETLVVEGLRNVLVYDEVAVHRYEETAEVEDGKTVMRYVGSVVWDDFIRQFDGKQETT